MAPEVFNGHYTEKADVFSLGVIFFAILERDFFVVDKPYYGAFISIFADGKVGKVGIGEAMAKYNDPNIRIQFSAQCKCKGDVLILCRG